MQTDFMEKYYQHFDDTEENKFIYTDIQKEYVRKVFFYLSVHNASISFSLAYEFVCCFLSTSTLTQHCLGGKNLTCVTFKLKFSNHKVKTSMDNSNSE